MTGRPRSGRRLSSRENDDAQFDIYRSAALSPWNASTPATTPRKPHRPTQHHGLKGNKSARERPTPPVTARKISIGAIHPVKVPWPRHERDSFQPHFPIVPQLPKLSDQTGPTHTLKIAKAGRNRSDRLDATPVAQAYQDLLEQTEAMELESTENSEKREQASGAYQMGLANLSEELVRRQKEFVRFHTLKNEIDIFQQHLDPFVYDIQTEHERQVNSSVYRHFNRMRAIQDMGIPIYSLGEYLFEDNDRIITARTKNSLYRRVRRRSAADYMDTELIPRPERKRSVALSPSIISE